MGHFTPRQLVHTLFSIEKLECISYSYSLICSVNYSGNLPSYPSANSTLIVTSNLEQNVGGLGGRQALFQNLILILRLVLAVTLKNFPSAM